MNGLTGERYGEIMWIGGSVTSYIIDQDECILLTRSGYYLREHTDQESGQS